MVAQNELFVSESPLPPGVTVLRAQTSLVACLPDIEALALAAPWRHWQIPGGGVMSVESTNAGAVGWCSDRSGYRYAAHDPMTDRPWPPIPHAWLAQVSDWASIAGYPDFSPDCCLVNRYLPGARMGTHRDADELDFSQPIVSVSLGLPATFVWLGAQRQGRGLPIYLEDGDVVIFGGPARRGYHRVRPVRANPGTTQQRINLTFRRAR
jgi:alkylated DNA repair protein (DNA oxidative demethylase)